MGFERGEGGIGREEGFEVEEELERRQYALLLRRRWVSERKKRETDKGGRGT